MKKATAIFIILILTLSPAVIEAEAQTSFSLSQDADSAVADDTLTVVLCGNDLVDLYAYEAIISYNTEGLEFDSATPLLQGFLVPPKSENGKLMLAFTKIGKVGGENGNLPLMRLTFKVKDKGQSSLKIASVKAVDSKLASTVFRYGKTFLDLAGFEWAKMQIEYLAELGIIKGTSEITFSPKNNITRADFVTLLVRAYGLKAAFEENFRDVLPTDYFYEPVGIAKSLGIVKGKGDNLFYPRENISRQDMMVMVARTKEIVGVKSAETGNSLSEFHDVAEISPYALEAVSSLVREGIIKGYNGAINPRGTLTRAEAAVVIYELVMQLGGEETK